MTFNLHLDTGAAAFHYEGAGDAPEGADEQAGQAEIRELLAGISEKVGSGHTSGRVIDHNGNTCGHWRWDRG